MTSRRRNRKKKQKGAPVQPPQPTPPAEPLPLPPPPQEPLDVPETVEAEAEAEAESPLVDDPPPVVFEPSFAEAVEEETEDAPRPREASLWCPECASVKIARSQRRGLNEAWMLWAERLAPYRCTDCEARFFRPARHRATHKHVPGALGLDERTKRKVVNRILTAVLVLVVLLLTWGLLELLSPQL
jgi:hypothetical protein